MPNTDQIKTGSSFKERMAVAAHMTRQQQAQRDAQRAQRKGGDGFSPHSVDDKAPAKKTKPAKRTRSAADALTQGGDAQGSKASKAGGTAGKRGKDGGRNGKTASTHHKGKQQVHGRSSKELPHQEEPAGAGGVRSLARFLPKGKLRVALIVVCVFAVALAIVYPTAKSYYQAMREGQRYEAQLAAVQARNDALEKDTEALKTDEGIEAQARKDYGYVKKGDKSAVVTNADEDGSSSLKPGQIDTSEIEAPVTWYYSILDKVFFYDGS